MKLGSYQAKQEKPWYYSQCYLFPRFPHLTFASVLVVLKENASLSRPEGALHPMFWPLPQGRWCMPILSWPLSCFFPASLCARLMVLCMMDRLILGCCCENSFLLRKGSAGYLHTLCKWSCLQCYLAPAGFFWGYLDLWGMVLHLFRFAFIDFVIQLTILLESWFIHIVPETR